MVSGGVLRSIDRLFFMMLPASRLRLAVTFFFALTLLAEATPAAAPVPANQFHFKTDELVTGLSSNLVTLMVYKKVPDEVRGRAARDLYALLFQLWLVKGRHVDPSLEKQYVRLVMRYTSLYVEPDDPLSLLSHYKGDTLDEVGVAVADQQPLEHADTIFQKKAAYQHLVADFSHWTFDPK